MHGGHRLPTTARQEREQPAGLALSSEPGRRLRRECPGVVAANGFDVEEGPNGALQLTAVPVSKNTTFGVRCALLLCFWMHLFPLPPALVLSSVALLHFAVLKAERDGHATAAWWVLAHGLSFASTFFATATWHCSASLRSSSAGCPAAALAQAVLAIGG